MYFNGEWGTICSDGWDATDVGVACRQLGFGSSGLTRQFGPGSGVILMNNAACLGNESMLIDCSYTGTGISNCSHSDDAGVICNGQTPGDDL